MASETKIDVQKERKALTNAKALLDDVHFLRPVTFSEPALRCCDIVWLRPKSVTEEPQVYVPVADGSSKIGRLRTANSIPEFEWFMVPLAQLCNSPKLIFKMLSEDENFDADYGGMFKVKFYSSGNWQEIIIDDRLPCHSCDQSEIRPYFATIETGFWLPLIIKAYAKLHGSYEKLIGGIMSEAYAEFTAGITEIFPLNSLRPKFHVSLKKFFDSSSLLTAEYVHKDEPYGDTSYWNVVDMECKEYDIPNLEPTD
ncbi:unnamed protein product, partial [Nesidiocoris tenuis]